MGKKFEIEESAVSVLAFKLQPSYITNILPLGFVLNSSDIT